MRSVLSTQLEVLARGSNEMRAQRMREAVAAVRESEFPGTTKVEVRLTFPDHAIVATDGPHPLARVSFHEEPDQSLVVLSVDPLNVPVVEEPTGLGMALDLVLAEAVETALEGKPLDSDTLSTLVEHAHLLVPESCPDVHLERIEELVGSARPWRTTMGEMKEAVDTACAVAPLMSARHPARFWRLYESQSLSESDRAAYLKVLDGTVSGLLRDLSSLRGRLETVHAVVSGASGRLSSTHEGADWTQRTLALVEDVRADVIDAVAVLTRAFEVLKTESVRGRAYDRTTVILTEFDRATTYLESVATLVRSAA